MSHKRSCKKDPARIARQKSAAARKAAFDELSPEEQKAQKAANKFAYHARKV